MFRTIDPCLLVALLLLVALYVAFVMGMSTISTMAAILVLYYHHHLPNYRVPRIIRVIFFQVSSGSGLRLFVLYQGLAQMFCMMFVLFQGLAEGICRMFLLQCLADGDCMIFVLFQGMF